jgi:hypothetical protein
MILMLYFVSITHNITICGMQCARSCTRTMAHLKKPHSLVTHIAFRFKTMLGCFKIIVLFAGAQLCDEVMAIPLGVLLVFQRVSEQMGFDWNQRVLVTLCDPSVSWMRENRGW